MWIVASTALALLATACVTASTEESAVPVAGTVPSNVDDRDVGPPERGGSLTVAIDIEPTGLVPQGEQWTTQGAFHIANALFDPLVALDADGAARPYLAESIVPNEMFTEWTITLRPGVRFHDGTPFDATALTRNLDAMRSSLTGVLLGPLESTQVTGELTAVVTLSSPWSQFPYNLARQGGYMVAPATLDDPDGTNRPIGTGPFVFDSWERGSTLTATRNADYWREGLPHLDEMTFVVVDDPTSRLASVTSGTADAAVLASAAQVRAASEAAGTGSIQFFSDRDLETDEEIVLLNTTRAPFDDPNARRAVAHAIDRAALERTTGRPTTVGPFQEGSSYYVDPDEAGWPAYDVARATERSASQYQADHGRPLSFRLMTIGDSDTQAQAQVLQSQLAAAGIDLQLETVEIAATSLRLIERDFDAVLSGFLSSPTIDQSYIFFEPPPPGGGLSVNFTGLADAELVAALDAARATDDPAVWVEQHTVVQRRMAANLDRLFTVTNVIGLAYADDVHGVTQGTFPGSEDTAYAGTTAVPIGVATWRRA